VLQHVSIEITPGEASRAVEFWRLLGFEPVEPPPGLRDRASWVERAATQVHLVYVERPTVPPLGHAAVVVEDFERAIAALRAAGHEVEERPRHWGARRAVAVSPGGHRVELMASPPPRNR
jgi:catechol 2,3-dioxygenase-like lactoylglutathione lyase family enzyme